MSGAKIMAAVIMALTSVVFTGLVCQGDQANNEQVAQLVQRYVTSARESLMESWGVFDMIRRITIDPVSKKNFMIRAAPDVVKMTSSVASLAGVCAVFPAHCRSCSVDLNDLIERFAGIADAFSAITIADPKSEEIVLAHLLDESHRLLRECLAY